MRARIGGAARPGKTLLTSLSIFLALACTASCSQVKKPVLPADTLVVYSPHELDIVRFVTAEFRSRSKRDIRVVQGGTGGLLARLKEESAAPQASVFWGGGAESLQANTDLFEPIPAQADSGRSWSPFTVLPMVIVWNARLVPAERAPRSWKDAMDPWFAGLVAFADPTVSGSAYTILRTVEEALVRDGLAPDRAGADAAFARALKGRSMRESALVARAVASGESLVGFTYESSAAEIMAAGSDLRVVYPSDGTSAVPDGVALVRGAPTRDEALEFIDFVLGADVAKVMAGRFGRRPALGLSPTPQGLPELSSIAIAPYDIDEASRDKAATLARFAAAMKAAAGE
ncbi:MAG: extracellular solute-binding protein [Spirochaetes bacterium]|nr:extracellular solute-binding protein [Spirochaetota bacterium]